ncbi:hypothetical protein [Paludibacterium yongneupense]|uniref:hypothetical protein n=1 Tax=Paludibacterium yongneupense TaxID=400061 RepID=UPI000418856C|nr:hypothetical protein [Paludibacterium yongneupense]
MSISELQIERQLEQFFAVQGWPGWRPSSRCELELPPVSIYFEVCGGQLASTLARPVPDSGRQQALLALLALCRPEATQGAPLLGFLLGPRLALRCTWPPPGDIALWVGVFRQQQRLLERAARGGG